jgi:hypothetical protein
MSLLNAFRKKRNFLLFLMAFLVVLSGCGSSQENSQSGVIGNPTPKDFLEDGNADIFVFNNIVFSNVQHISWVKELDYTKGEVIGEITKQTSEANEFENGTSNKLPIGTKIYATDTQIYIAIVDGEEIPYLKMLEG